MKKTLQEQIQANRRGSILLAFIIIVLLTALGAAIAGTYAPRQWYLGAGGAALLGLIMAWVSNRSGSNIILSISRAREATQAEDQVLNNVVEEMAIAAGIPKPKVYVIDDASPNAFATGRNPEEASIAVTTGLLQKLDRDELQGVMAHEMSHIRNDDIKFMTTVTVVAGLIPLLADLFVRMQWFGGGSRRDRDRDDNSLASIFMIVGFVLSIVAPIFAGLLELAVSRKREYLADASAAELTRYPEGLARALRKIASDPDPLQVANRATQHMYIVNPLKLIHTNDLLSTHPDVEARIAALMGLAGTRSVPPLA
ncbi:M48 family metallopeptidase [Fimbriimonas ginsengisoli]|uniref:Protease HtpX homolog n=1 Tax=Fimbriimonas ginsengisoli Gsoil 348 TaxID=661478 RepID=A0A068NMX5_FIMGI|nr:M48 family metallopeptidase [Fimbriimonas ginsengisoli]AIE84918.1 HtpX-2 peptidase [Fimbriimonas ginsengisoli Gsoil 348]